jgi:phosphoribosylanthranilate isomerase
MSSSRVKICGLRRPSDIEYVNKLLPEFVGFVFASSRRQVSFDQAKQLISALDNRIKTVGVFVNDDIERVKLLADSLKLNVLQFHGSEDVNYIKNLANYEIWKVVSIKTDDGLSLNKAIKENQKNIDWINNSSIDGIVLDSEAKGIQGGTGITFNWEIIKELNIKKQLILAGGLNCQNITEAISNVRPAVVDVSSGVETEGIKDFNKMNEFINKVRMIV